MKPKSQTMLPACQLEEKIKAIEKFSASKNDWTYNQPGDYTSHKIWMGLDVFRHDANSLIPNCSAHGQNLASSKPANCIRTARGLNPSVGSVRLPSSIVTLADGRWIACRRKISEQCLKKIPLFSIKNSPTNILGNQTLSVHKLNIHNYAESQLC
jgi:hypothetical protein